MAWILLIFFFLPVLWAQQPPATGDMKVRINYLNVCAPSEEDQRSMAAALTAIPASPHFAPDFEVARGRTTESGAAADWVRIRREMSSGPLTNAQYSMSVDSKGIIETGVFRWREPKDVLQVSIEDSVSAGTPAMVLASDTPATRIRVERFGKNSLVAVRCAQTDQHALEPLFAQASIIMTRYRAALGIRQTVPGELSKLGVGAAPKRKPR